MALFCQKVQWSVLPVHPSATFSVIIVAACMGYFYQFHTAVLNVGP